jgi:hypothetical protein
MLFATKVAAKKWRTFFWYRIGTWRIKARIRKGSGFSVCTKEGYFKDR